jgi:transcriptional regulator with XRE-family HTH domain
MWYTLPYLFVYYTILLGLVDAHSGLRQFVVMSDMELYRQLGREVAKRREALGLTQAQVAVQLGLTRASLANLENGRQRILVHQLFRLVDALNLKSILDLVPPKWNFEGILGALRFNGSELTVHEQAGVHQLLRTAIGEKRGRKKEP